MIVCHCNGINSSMIETSTLGIAGQGACDPPTPEDVYVHLGVEPCCRGCFPLAARVISDSLASSGRRCGGDLIDAPAMVPAE